MRKVSLFDRPGKHFAYVYLASDARPQVVTYEGKTYVNHDSLVYPNSFRECDVAEGLPVEPRA